MRISDWSSDVCSSDLRHDAVRRGNRFYRRVQQRQPVAWGAAGDGRRDAVIGAVRVGGAGVQRQSGGHRIGADDFRRGAVEFCRSEEHTSELQSLMRNSYAVFCLKKKNKGATHKTT